MFLITVVTLTSMCTWESDTREVSGGRSDCVYSPPNVRRALGDPLVSDVRSDTRRPVRHEG